MGFESAQSGYSKLQRFSQAWRRALALRTGRDRSPEGLRHYRHVQTAPRGADTVALTRELQSHGIRVQGSTIIGMDHHTAATMREEIEHAVAHDADCHQFML